MSHLSKKSKTASIERKNQQGREKMGRTWVKWGCRVITGTRVPGKCFFIVGDVMTGRRKGGREAF